MMLAILDVSDVALNDTGHIPPWGITLRMVWPGFFFLAGFCAATGGFYAATGDKLLYHMVYIESWYLASVFVFWPPCLMVWLAVRAVV